MSRARVMLSAMRPLHFRGEETQAGTTPECMAQPSSGPIGVGLSSGGSSVLVLSEDGDLEGLVDDDDVDPVG